MRRCFPVHLELLLLSSFSVEVVRTVKNFSNVRKTGSFSHESVIRLSMGGR